MNWKQSAVIAVVAILSASTVANARVRITEWQYNGSEYIEFTNIGVRSVDMTGWSFDDDSQTPGVVSLSGLGTLAPRASGILSEEAADAFRTRWAIPLSIPIVGGNAANLGRNDEINLFNDLGQLVDRLTFGDQNFPGTIRTQDISGNPARLGIMEYDTVDPLVEEGEWLLSFVGDRYGSYQSVTGGFIGNPGVNVIPEPTSIALLAIGLVAIAQRRRRG